MSSQKLREMEAGKDLFVKATSLVTVILLFNNHQKFSWTNSKWLTIECLWYFRKSVYDFGGGQLIFSIRWVSKTLCWQIFSVVFEVLVKLAVRLILTLTKMTKYPWQFLKSSVHLGGNIDQQRELISREKFSNPSTQNDEISYDPH